jgi:PAS domain S-box-containing protein
MQRTPDPHVPPRPAPISPRVALRAIVVEDSEIDLLVLLSRLKAAGYDVHHRWVDSLDALRAALPAEPWDVIISDYVLSDFDGLDVLNVVRESAPDLPFIVVSGAIGDDVAVAAMRAGAQDYLRKPNLHRLPAIIDRELQNSAERRVQLAAHAQLRESELRLHSILATLEDIIWSIDLKTQRLVYLNPAAVKIYGVPATAFLDGSVDWLDMVHPDDRDKMRLSFKEVSKVGNLTTEYRIVRPDGEIRWIHDRAQVVCNDAGTRIRVDGIARDVTEQIQSGAPFQGG